MAPLRKVGRLPKSVFRLTGPDLKRLACFMQSTSPVALTIAGSDSGGGAGIQADLKTFQFLGCFGTTAITAVTCQNTRGVSAVQGLAPDIVRAQIRDVLLDFPVAAAKTGMLYSAEIIQSVALEWGEHGGNIPLVVDPVMVATSGDRLLEAAGERALIDFLGRATLITPNLPEAEVILGRAISPEPADMKEAACEIQKRHGAAVLLKGGHKTTGAEMIDVLVNGSESQFIVRPRIRTSNTHGTGCTLSAAITAGLAKGESLARSVSRARDYLQRALESAPAIGSGHGPLNHSPAEQPLP